MQTALKYAAQNASRYLLSSHRCSSLVLSPVLNRCNRKTRSYSSDAMTTKVNEKMDFTIFYRFSHIRLVRFLSRLKIYQTAATAIAIPPVVYCYSIGLAGLDSLVTATGLSSCAMVLLYVVGNFFRRVVGLVSLSADEQVVRISRLTFWGNRRDVYVSPHDIVALGDFEDNVNDAYVKLRFYNQPDIFYLFLKYGKIEDRVRFAKVFGNH